MSDATTDETIARLTAERDAARAALRVCRSNQSQGVIDNAIRLQQELASERDAARAALGECINTVESIWAEYTTTRSRLTRWRSERLAEWRRARGEK
jgi:hypothetical protein